MANIADLTLAIASTGPNGRQTSDSIDYNERKTIHDYDYESKYDSDSESDYEDSDYDDYEDSYYDIARELNEHGQCTYTPRKKDPLFLKRMIELDQDAKVKIAKLKTLLPQGTEKEESISILETFSVNDRYEDREKKEDKIDILIEKMWVEGDISNYEDEIARTYSKLQNIFRTTTAMWGDFIKTPETKYSESLKQKEDEELLSRLLQIIDIHVSEKEQGSVDVESSITKEHGSMDNEEHCKDFEF